MIIVRVPFRVSLFGGGTDFETFFSKRNSKVISFSIDKYCYVNLRKLLPYFGSKYRISWSLIEEVSSLEEITHPSIKACIEYLKVKDGLEINTVGDLPARSGLGSSSSFTAGMLAALYTYKKTPFTKSRIANDTIKVEQSILKENVGLQDQIQVCLGGFNLTTIFEDATYSTLSLNNTSKFVNDIDQSLVLVYSGITRISSDIHELHKMEVTEEIKNKSLNKINFIANQFSEYLIKHEANFDIFTKLMLDSWDAKFSSFPKNNLSDKILKIYKKGINSGAKCGKLLGAGGGGFFAFFVPKEVQNSFIISMKEFICVPCNISYNGIEILNNDNF